MWWPKRQRRDWSQNSGGKKISHLNDTTSIVCPAVAIFPGNFIKIIYIFPLLEETPIGPRPAPTVPFLSKAKRGGWCDKGVGNALWDSINMKKKVFLPLDEVKS